MLELMNMVFVLVDQVETNFSNYWHKKSLKINFCITSLINKFVPKNKSIKFNNKINIALIVKMIRMILLFL